MFYKYRYSNAYSSISSFHSPYLFCIFDHISVKMKSRGLSDTDIHNEIVTNREPSRVMSAAAANLSRLLGVVAPFPVSPAATSPVREDQQEVVNLVSPASSGDDKPSNG